MRSALLLLLFLSGASVAEGEPIATVCAMKMDVKVVAPFACVVKSHAIKAGDKVVGGALISTIAKS